MCVSVSVCVCVCGCGFGANIPFILQIMAKNNSEENEQAKKERKEAEQTTRTTSATGNDVYGPPFWPLAAILCNFFCAEPPLPHTVTAVSESFFQVVPRVI